MTLASERLDPDRAEESGPGQDRLDVEPAPVVTSRSRASAGSRWWAAVAGLTLVQLVVRVWALLGIDTSQDDVAVAYRALDSRLTRDFLLGTYQGHWGPLTRALEWVTVHAAPFNVGVAFAVVVVLLLLADVGMILLLRQLFGTRGVSLAVYTFWILTPVVATTLGSWSLGLLLVPMLAGMAWTTLFHVRSMRGPGSRVAAQLGAVACLAAVLLVSPQSLFLVPFLALLTLCYPGLEDEAVRLRTALRRTALMWTGYAVVLVGYYLAYRAAGPERNSRPLTGSALGEVLGGLGFTTAFPSLVGGPWASDPGTLPSVVGLSELGLSIVIQVVALLVVTSIAMRPRAWRAWAILLVMLLANVVVVAIAVRSDLLGGAVLRQTRYLMPVLVPACVLLGIAFSYGTPRRWFATAQATVWMRRVLAAGTVVLLCIYAESAWLTNYAQASAMKTASTSTFWSNVRQGLTDNPTASIIDRPMPSNVVFGGFNPEFAFTSQALRYFVGEQKWNAPAEKPLFITDDGRVVPARVAPFASSFPGQPGCGFPVTGQSAAVLDLNESAFNFGWGITMNYLAARDTVVTAVADGQSTTLPLHKGVGSITWVNPGTIGRVTIKSADPAGIGVCVDKVVVGGIVPTS